MEPSIKTPAIRHLIPQALTMIQGEEKTALTPYKGGADKKGVVTIGVGHVIGPGDQWMMHGLTPRQAQDIFSKDVARHCHTIQSDIGHDVPLDDWEYGALASFCFNLGARILTQAPSITSPIKAGLKHAGFLAMYKFSKGGRLEYEDGLFYRRLVEIVFAIEKKLIVQPHVCTLAIAVIDSLKPYGDTTEMSVYFASHHNRRTCNVCKYSKKTIPGYRLNPPAKPGGTSAKQNI